MQKTMIWYALMAVSFVSLLSLLGVIFMVMKRSTLFRVIAPLLAFSSGVLLGSAFFDLIPESTRLLPEQGYIIMLAGIIAFFTLEKLLNWHHHVEGDHPGETKAAGYLTLIGDGIHNFIDGVVIGGAFLVSSPLGISVTIAVVAHEIPHELADFTILIHSGFTNGKALIFNFLSALTAILGTLLVLQLSHMERAFVPYLIPFGAGNFLYIAMSDLIPELHRSRSKRSSVIEIAALILGAVAIFLLPKD